MSKGWKETYIFREVMTPLPKGWLPGHWQVEAHRENGIEAYCCPVAIAWVNCCATANGMPPVIEFVHVLPQFSRQGVATRLCLACIERWPDAWLTDGISAAGKRLLNRVEALRPKRMSVAAIGGP